MRTGFLWSLWNIANENIKEHIVLQTPPTIQNHRLFVEQILSHGIDPYYETRKFIRFSNDFGQEDSMTTTVSLRTVFNAREPQVPPFHIFTRSHFLQFSYSIYASIMTYLDYCQMEDKLSHIVNQYLDDEKNKWLIMMDDPILIANIRNYGRKRSILDHTTWITTEKTYFNNMLLVDIQEDYPHV